MKVRSQIYLHPDRKEAGLVVQKQTGKQADKQTNKQTNKQTDQQTKNKKQNKKGCLTRLERDSRSDLNHLFHVHI